MKNKKIGKIIKPKKYAQEEPSKTLRAEPSGYIVLSYLKSKKVIMELEKRLNYLGLNPQEREEFIRRDKIGYIKHIIEKADILTQNEKNNLAIINNTTGMGEYGQNIPSMMQELLEGHSNLSDDIVKFLGYYPVFDSWSKSYAMLYNIASSALGEVIELFVTMQDSLVDMDRLFKEKQDAIVGLDSEISERNAEKSNIADDMRNKREEIKIANENLERTYKEAAECAKKAEDLATIIARSDMVIKEKQLEIGSAQKTLDEIIRLKSQTEQELIAMNTTIRDINTGKFKPHAIEIQQSEILKRNNQVGPDGSPLTNSNNNNLGKMQDESGLVKIGRPMVCKNKKCFNHAPGNWIYTGKSRIAPCSRCGTRNKVNNI